LVLEQNCPTTFKLPFNLKLLMSTNTQKEPESYQIEDTRICGVPYSLNYKLRSPLFHSLSRALVSFLHIPHSVTEQVENRQSGSISLACVNTDKAKIDVA
jgi:hypothetical protein